MSDSVNIQPIERKLKRRGFVLTGGGAKGLYEAGVIHALHISGMEFDVITGSSIGAINSVFFAEYLFRKRQLPADVLGDPLRAINEMDNLIKAYHHTWLQMPDKKLIDDSQAGALGKIEDDLSIFHLDLSQMIQLGWWWTDPKHGTLPSAKLWPGLIKLGRQLLERLGGPQQLMRIIKENRSALFRELLRTYLARFGMDRSIVPPEEDHKIEDMFTQPASPLKVEHLTGTVSTSDPAQVEQFSLVDPQRTLRDYAEKGIAVRLTRANYRTGRLEISAYLSMEDFVNFMEKQAWRLKVFGPEKLPLGSFRLVVPGNPNAIKAALCSGRFPGVFVPFPIEDLYPTSDPDNLLLRRLLTSWISDGEIEKQMTRAYQSIHPQAKVEKWKKLLWDWQTSRTIRDFFPTISDTYVDGGAIDNTPTNPAVDFVREWIAAEGLSKRDVVLDLFVVFLDAEPKVDQVKANDPAIFDVVARTLALQSAATRSSDANTVDTINAFGQHGEELGRVLRVLLKNYQENLTHLNPSEVSQAREELRENLRVLGIHDLTGKADQPSEDMIDQIKHWSDKVIDKGLPLHVNVVRIYPEEMPLDTLQFTERLGYRKENAIKMLTMGCYNTLWAIRQHLEAQKLQDLDERDQLVLTLVQKWMNGIQMPESATEREKLSTEWQCQRTECVFREQFCKHGMILNSSL